MAAKKAAFQALPGGRPKNGAHRASALHLLLPTHSLRTARVDEVRHIEICPNSC